MAGTPVEGGMGALMGLVTGGIGPKAQSLGGQDVVRTLLLFQFS